MPATTRPRHVVLVGMMATGKTTVGRLVATELGTELVDSDAQVEALTGRTVRDIWRNDGEEEFRRLETAALEDALGRAEESVIAAAGGVVLSDVNRSALAAADAIVVWLRASVPTLVERVIAAGDGHRPLLDDDPEGMLEAMSRDRSQLYEDVADVIVDVDGATIDQVVASVVDLVRPRERR